MMLPALLAAMAIRLLNPNDGALDATLRCGDATRSVHLEAHELRDLDEECTSADALLPLLALAVVEDRQSCLSCDADGQDSDRQDLDRQDSDRQDCLSSTSMFVPLFACRGGEAAAYVQPVDGATYTWTAEGAAIVSGAGTHRVTLHLGKESTAKLNVSIATNDCTKSATGVISVREPIEVRELVVPATAEANQPVTIRWSYAPGREPVSQLLLGSAFAQPVVLSAQQRSYTFTPATAGARTVELRASYANGILVAAPKRRRASGGTAVAATECPSAQATRTIDIRGCSSADPLLDAPEDVIGGEVFAVTTNVGEGEKVEWSVENGTVQSTAPFGENVIVVAGASGKVVVTARVVRAAGCVATASAEVPIIAAIGQCARVPEATLSIAGRDCDSATVQATFTGTPPFAGEWSDGTPFRTGAHAIVHEFQSLGELTIRGFHDGSCFGAVRGATTLTRLQPSVTLSGTSSCGSGSVTATFTGVPPFRGTWSDGQPFTTSASTLQRAVGPGDWSVAGLTDSACSTAPATSNVYRVPAPPRLSAGTEPYCQIPGATTGVAPRITGGSPPYTVVWSDGVVTESATADFSRLFADSPEPVRTYQITRATANGCAVELVDATVTILRRDYAAGDYRGSTHCVATDAALSLSRTPSTPGAVITWTFGHADVKIVSGQGTATPVVRAERALQTYAVIETTYPDGHCAFTASRVPLEFRAQSNVNSAQLVPDTIPRFGTAQLFLNVGGVPQTLTVTPSRGSFSMNGCCGGSYHDTTGTPGTVPFTIRWSDPCLGPREMTVTLTITP